MAGVTPKKRRQKNRQKNYVRRNRKKTEYPHNNTEKPEEGKPTEKNKIPIYLVSMEGKTISQLVITIYIYPFFLLGFQERYLPIFHHVSE